MAKDETGNNIFRCKTCDRQFELRWTDCGNRALWVEKIGLHLHQIFGLDIVIWRTLLSPLAPGDTPSYLMVKTKSAGTTITGPLQDTDFCPREWGTEETNSAIRHTPRPP